MNYAKVFVNKIIMQTKNTPKLLLMVAYHKDHHTLEDSKKYYDPIQVGKENSHLDLGILSDNNGADNISAKNENYCELTALYYAWKNTDYEYYGLMHYRRYFTRRYTLKLFGKKIAEYTSKNYITKESCIKLLSKYDIILPYPYGLSSTAYKNYAEHHQQKDLDLVKGIIKDKYIDFLPHFELAMNVSNTAYYFNMFITKKSFFNEYMTWLFGIFDELESVIVISDDLCQKRVFGFLAERMFNVFISYKIHHSAIKIKELNVTELHLN